MKLREMIFIMTGMLLLSSCSLLSPVKVEVPNQYLLNVTPPCLQKIKERMKSLHASHHHTLLILTPETQPAYDTTQMAYSIRPHQIAYFSRNQWAETPSQMLQPLLAQTMRNTHHFHAVAEAPFTGHYDEILSTRIIKLQQDFTHPQAVLQLTVSAQLIQANTGQIIATRVFSEEKPMALRAPWQGVIAANQAVFAILQRMAVFIIHY